MFLVSLISFLIAMLVNLVFFMGIILGKKKHFSREKVSPFECGFMPKFNARLPFSMRFFMICLIFLVFDVELVLMFPFILSMLLSNILVSQFIMIMFLVILALGLFYEWNQGSLDWLN